MIAFSGIDCAGKSTQIERVKEMLETHGRRCKIIHSRGGYTPLLEFIKNLVRPDKHTDESSQELYRSTVHSNTNKRKLLLWLSILDLVLYYGIYFRFVELFGNTILADRYFWDSCIDFQMKYGEFDFESWRVWGFAKLMHLKPKESIVYIIPAELSMYRSTLKYEPWPEIEEVRKERINHYIHGIQNGKWDHVIDASGSIEEVFAMTVKELRL